MLSTSSKGLNKKNNDAITDLGSNIHMSQVKSVDAGVIENLKALGGIELLTELHTVFISTSETIIADLHKAIAAGDPLGVQDKAHSLKSSSGNMGALQLSQLCLQLEKMGQAKDLTQAKNIAQSLEQEFKKVSLELGEIVSAK